MTELEVPPESFDAMGSLWTGDEESAEFIRAIAAPVVAAELRFWAERSYCAEDARWLRARAAELDGGAS